MRFSTRIVLALSVLLARGTPAQDVAPPLDSVQPDSQLLGRALKAHAEDLALGFLAETYSLVGAHAAARGFTIHTTLDGHDQTVNQANAARFVNLYEVRLKTYDIAIRRHGFPTIAGLYHTTISAQCDRLGFTEAETTIKQQDFRFQLANDSISHNGIAVESALVVEHAADPEVHLVGRVTEGRIVLEHKGSKCVLTLTRSTPDPKQEP